MTFDKKKKQLEKMRVECAKAEMELRIEEREDEIKRLRENIIIQDKRIAELDEELNK
jgi:hypothetical protein